MPVIFKDKDVFVKTEREHNGHIEDAYESDPVFFYSIYVKDKNDRFVRRERFGHRERLRAINRAKELSGMGKPVYIVVKTTSDPAAPAGSFKSKEIVAGHTSNGNAMQHAANLRFNDPVTVVRGSVVEIPLDPREY